MELTKLYKTYHFTGIYIKNFAIFIFWCYSTKTPNRPKYSKHRLLTVWLKIVKILAWFKYVGYIYYDMQENCPSFLCNSLLGPGKGRVRVGCQ